MKVFLIPLLYNCSDSFYSYSLQWLILFHVLHSFFLLVLINILPLPCRCSLQRLEHLTSDQLAWSFSSSAYPSFLHGYQPEGTSHQPRFIRLVGFFQWRQINTHALMHIQYTYRAWYICTLYICDSTEKRTEPDVEWAKVAGLFHPR